MSAARRPTPLVPLATGSAAVTLLLALGQPVVVALVAAASVAGLAALAQLAWTIDRAAGADRDRYRAALADLTAAGDVLCHAADCNEPECAAKRDTFENALHAARRALGHYDSTTPPARRVYLRPRQDFPGGPR